ncbi:alpha/beta hydrolase fold protein [Psychromonas ingrahamii 37]|uniref:Alpha/beta hydrolase fold protein n=1 Tax=Psychromonas ingrahamii (strain DSM 17664 / CCUG 51855 / 37) TaxID=357804 RepID=A1SZR2_PSYIN|nr:alpha/beta fold hydrolase [Psychromonas ingrahamii]ABM04977.1 alpha/beta hydrolase fold protein [Psychromonas ingrahamii 37]
MKKASQLRLLLPFLFLLSSALTSAENDMENNPYGLTTEAELSDTFNSKINAFWKKNAISVSLQGVDNKRLHTISIKTGNANAIVISQGRNESVLKYKELAFDLNRQGYDLYLIDHRGQGFSERLGGDQDHGHVVHFQDYVDDLNRYILSLDLANNYQHNYLLAHSMGGTISALYLEQYNHPFQAAILLSPMMSINLGSIPSFIAKLLTFSGAEVCSWFSDQSCYVFGGKEYKPRAFIGNDLTSSEVRFNASQNTYIEFPETQLGDASMRWVAQSLSATGQVVDNANKINIPILLLQAGADQVVTAAGQNQFFKNITQCKAKQFLTIPNAKHEIYLEKDQSRLVALNAALEFLEASQQGTLRCTK